MAENKGNSLTVSNPWAMGCWTVGGENGSFSPHVIRLALSAHAHSVHNNAQHFPEKPRPIFFVLFSCVCPHVRLQDYSWPHNLSARL